MSSNLPTLEQVLDKIVEIGEADPDFIYTSQPEYNPGDGCYYIGANSNGDGRPCIVGQALLDLGVDRDRVGGFDQDGASIHLPEVLRLQEWDDEIMDKIQSIQCYQDAGTPWGKAVKEGVSID